jgi:HSP90 family molecular chaperone
LGTKEIQNPLSGETEQRQVLTVVDRGIGMDKEIIQRYFLQVGRSYYTTDEFRRNFRLSQLAGLVLVFSLSLRLAIM